MMQTRAIYFAAVAAALVSAGGTRALGAFGDFSYTSRASIAGGALGGIGAPVSTTIGATNITLTPLAETGLNAAQAGTDIVFGNIAVTSTSATDQSIGNVTYSFVLNITNADTGTSAPVTINGTLTGTARMSAANISNLYTAPLVSGTGPLPTNYVVDVSPGQGSYTAPSPSSPGVNGRPGTFGAHVMAVPEPTSVALLGMGVVGLVGVARRRRA